MSLTRPWVVLPGRPSNVTTRLQSCTRAFVVGIVILLGSVASAGAAESPIVPPGFALRATHGYWMSVMAFANPHTGTGAVIVTLRSRHASVSYTGSAVVGQMSIEADLGEMGRVDVDFVSSGRSRTERSTCGRPILVESGRYEGTIDFEGEDGYSGVHATSARGEARGWLSVLCVSGGSEGTGGHSPGARLTVRHPRPSGFEFSAMENSPRRPARFTASVEERRGPLRISRSVGVVAGPGAFDFDVPSGTARARPPKPFSGSASFRRRPGAKPSWRGDLSVDFPGRPNVRLTGPGARASLIRAVLNPGHPF